LIDNIGYVFCELSDYKDGLGDNRSVWVNYVSPDNEYVNPILYGCECEIGRDYVIDWDMVRGTF